VTWTTAATIPGTTYSYVPPSAEVNTTVDFRIVGQNGATSSVPSATQAVALTVVMAQPVITSIVFSGTPPYAGYGAIMVNFTDTTPGAIHYAVGSTAGAPFLAIHGASAGVFSIGPIVVQAPGTPGAYPAQGSTWQVFVQGFLSYSVGVVAGPVSATFNFGVVP